MQTPDVAGAITHALINAVNNAVNAQQQSNVTAQAACTMGVASILSVANASAVDARLPADLRAEIDNALSATKAAAPAPVDANAIAAAARGDAQNLRSIIDEFAAGMNRLSDARFHDLMHIVQMATVAACARAMLADPDKIKQYEAIMAAVKNAGTSHS